MSSGSVLPVVAIQAAAFLVPLAAGLAGLIPGAAAGFASVTVWFAVGLPLSYSCVDLRRNALSQSLNHHSRLSHQRPPAGASP